MNLGPRGEETDREDQERRWDFPPFFLNLQELSAMKFAAMNIHSTMRTRSSVILDED